MRPQDIISRSDQLSKIRSSKQGITAKLYKVEGNKIFYTVTSSNKDRNYLVTIQLLSLTANKLKSLKSALSGDIRISCTCDAFLYQGYKYISWKAQAGIDSETRPPDIRNPERKGMACKHILVALNKLKSDYSSIYTLLKSQIPKDNNPRPSGDDARLNKNSNEPTEIDLKAIENFKNVCLSLYDNYNKFNKENSDENATFLNSDYYDKQDPTLILSSLSKPVSKAISKMFLGKLKSVNDILKYIDQKRNGFTVMLKSDTDTITKKINSAINSKTESVINNIILSLIES